MSSMPEKKRIIYLVGMPGAGKSTVGRALAKCLRLTFVDADHAITDRTGVAIATIFDLEGESGFRQREAALIEELSALSDIVVATGGGVIMRENNRALLRATGVVNGAEQEERERRQSEDPAAGAGDGRQPAGERRQTQHQRHQHQRDIAPA